MSDLQEKRARRRELRLLNGQAHKAPLFQSSKLDASLKKSTGFMKKLKTTTLGPDTLNSLLQDVKTIKLDMHAAEVAATMANDLKLKNSGEISAAAELCSLLHQTYPDFSPTLGPLLLKSLGPPPNSTQTNVEQREKEENVRISRQRAVLRLVTELSLLDVIRDKKNENLGHMVLTSLKEMLPSTKQGLSNLAIAVSFAKFYGDEFFNPEDAIVAMEVQKQLDTLFSDYFAICVKALKQVYSQTKDFYQTLRKGFEITEEQSQRYKDALSRYEKLFNNVKSLAEARNYTMPDLPDWEKEQIQKESIGIHMGNNRREERDLDLGPWEDEETRQFYQSLIDLKDYVPASLLGERQVEKEEKIELDDGLEVEEKEVVEEKVEEEPDQDSEPESEPFNKTPVDVWFTKMSQAMNRDVVDQLAVDFVYLKNKASQKRLAKSILKIPKSSLETSPYYCRLLATWKPFAPEMAQDVVDALEKDFYRIQKRKSKVSLEDKVKNLRLIGELVKFGVFSPSHTFKILKVLLNDFPNGLHSVELLTSFLETCGRFLAKGGNSGNVMMAEKTNNMLDIMLKKKAALHLDARQVGLVENAYFTCHPVERVTTVQKKKSAVELFVRKLIYQDLNKTNLQKVATLLSKLPWNDEPLQLPEGLQPLTQGEVKRLMNKIFTKVWKVKYSYISLLALLVSDLALHHQEFPIYIVDACLEEHRLGLETNLFKDNQKRIANIHYLGELYNVNVVGLNLILDTLYSTLCFGHDNGMFRPDEICVLDPPHDYFRIRLVCTLLNTIANRNFSRRIKGRQTFIARKLQAFWTFFQMYIYTKNIPPPMDIEFLLEETFDAYNKVFQGNVLFSNFEEAAQEFAATLKENIDLSLKEDVEEADLESEEEEEQVLEEDVLYQEPQGPSQEEEDDFDRELQRMMQESVSTRAIRAQPFEAAIPVKARTIQEEDGQVQFVVLTKKGKSQGLKTVSLPTTSALAQSTLQHQEEERLEQLELKRFVLESVETMEQPIGKDGPLNKLGQRVAIRRGPTKPVRVIRLAPKE